MASPYAWLTKTAAINALQGRLNNSSFWTAAECWLYIVEGLRNWAAMAECWPSDFVIANADGAWLNTGTLAGSPRLRSVTDVNLYTQMEYMLLEPPTGATWTGTKQFSLAALQYALQNRTQEVIQASACNLGQLSPMATTPGTRRNYLPDSVLEARRIRFLGVTANTTGTGSLGSQSITVASPAGVAVGMVASAAGVQANTFVTSVVGSAVGLSLPVTGALTGTAIQFAYPVTLTREDTMAFQYFEPNFLQEYGSPQSWSESAEPPLAFDVDIVPDTAGNYDVLALLAAPDFNPSSSPSLLGVPDDWSWLPMYGALADLLGREAEATDGLRAAYCMKRYTSGMELMQKSNWLKQGTVNGIAVDTPALAEQDTFAVEWQVSNGNLPAIVQAGMDFVAPTPGTGQSVGMTLIGNAPLLDATGVYVQVSRDDWQAVLDYAQHVAMFKSAGYEFEQTAPLLKSFYSAVGERNNRWMNYGMFTDILNTEGERQNEVEQR